jgi:hypothetical protein
MLNLRATMSSLWQTATKNWSPESLISCILSVPCAARVREAKRPMLLNVTARPANQKTRLTSGHA